jgi:hypothetical protein
VQKNLGDDRRRSASDHLKPGPYQDASAAVRRGIQCPRQPGEQPRAHQEAQQSRGATRTPLDDLDSFPMGNAPKGHTSCYSCYQRRFISGDIDHVADANVGLKLLEAGSVEVVTRGLVQVPSHRSGVDPVARQPPLDLLVLASFVLAHHANADVAGAAYQGIQRGRTSSGSEQTSANATVLKFVDAHCSNKSYCGIGNTQPDHLQQCPNI